MLPHHQYEGASEKVTDAARLAHLYGLERHDRLSQELHELQALARREAARGLLEAIYRAMGTDVKLERALEGVQRGLSLTVMDDDTRRFVGYVVGLQALLSARDAVIEAIRVLYDQVLDLDPDVAISWRRCIRSGDMEGEGPNGPSHVPGAPFTSARVFPWAGLTAMAWAEVDEYHRRTNGLQRVTRQS